jgi:hypothetical protein
MMESMMLVLEASTEATLKGPPHIGDSVRIICSASAACDGIAGKLLAA